MMNTSNSNLSTEQNMHQPLHVSTIKVTFNLRLCSILLASILVLVPMDREILTENANAELLGSDDVIYCKPLMLYTL